MEQSTKPRIAAILMADVVGYTRLVGEDEAATVRTLNAYREVFSSQIDQHGGRVVNAPGDSILAAFGSVVDATRSADFQSSLSRFAASSEWERCGCN